MQRGGGVKQCDFPFKFFILIMWRRVKKDQDYYNQVTWTHDSGKVVKNVGFCVIVPFYRLETGSLVKSQPKS
jgi:hypothetical protein